VNILTNVIGHLDNAYSIYALLEKRLGHKIFVPKESPEWGELGIKGQGIGAPHTGGTPHFEDGIEHVPIKYGPFVRRYVNAEQFLDMDFGAFLVTAAFHEKPFISLAKRFKPNAVFLRQIGQIGETPVAANNCLIAKNTGLKDGIRYIRYHPEQPAAYHYVPYPNGTKRIKSFSNYLRLHKEPVGLWDRAKELLPDFEFFMHGDRTDDGSILPIDLHLAMKDSMFIWHTKLHGGDGFVCTEALGCGRPMVVNMRYAIRYKTLAADYLKDGINCIDIDPAVRSLGEGLDILREWAKPENYEQKCKDVVRLFESHFDHDNEAEAVRKWLGTLPVVKDK